MALTDPYVLGQDLLTPPIASVSLVRINQEGNSSEFLLKASLSEFRIKVRHSIVKATATRAKMDRHNVEVVETIYVTATEPEFDRKVYFVQENLSSDAAGAKLNAFGLAYWLRNGTNYDQLTGWEV